MIVERPKTYSQRRSRCYVNAYDGRSIAIVMTGPLH